MAAKQEVTFVISARDRTRAVFRGIGRRVKQLGTRLLQLSGIATGLFVAFSRSTLNFATNIDAASRRLRVSGEAIQALEIIGADYGVTLEQIALVLQRLGTNAGEAVNDNKRMAEAFKELGLTVPLIERMSRIELFLGLAEGVKNFQGSAEQLQSTLRRIIDTEGIRLLPLLELGAEGLTEQLDLLRKRNLLIADPKIRDAAKEEAAIRRELLILQRDLNRQLLPVITAMTELLARGDADSVFPGGVVRTGAAVARGSIERLGAVGEAASSGLFDLQQEAARRGAGQSVRTALERIAANTEETARGVRDSGIIP